MLDHSTRCELVRLRALLGSGDEGRIDDLYQAFQEADHKDRGYLKDVNALSPVLRAFFFPNDLNQIDMEKLAHRFCTRGNHFDYVSFCKALQDQPSTTGQAQNPADDNRQSPTKKPRSPTPLRSPSRRTKRTKARYRSRTGPIQPAAIDRKMRVNKRLEAQRLLTESVRAKLLRGVVGVKGDGFSGLQNALQHIDTTGDGYLEVPVFMKQFVARLKEPLTRPEREFLLGQLRAQSSQHAGDTIDYEQIGRICGIDSDESLSGCDSNLDCDDGLSPTKTSQLGADFLMSEKRLRDFLQAPMGIVSSRREIGTPSADVETPRSVFTGAERFLEVAETIDSGKTGFLDEVDFTRVLSKCGISISPELLRGMLSRLTRSPDGLLNYSAFLLRYGQNPQHSRERRQLKRLILCFLSRLKTSGNEWMRFLRGRLEKYDAKVHGTKQGTLPSEAFLRAVQGRSAVLKLSTDEAAQATSLFLRVSSTSSPTRIQYHEFLRFADECHQASRYRWRGANTAAAPSTDKEVQLEVTAPAEIPTSAAVEASPESTAVQPKGPGTVGDYLMFHATEQERQNFEGLMDVLNTYQSSLQLPPDQNEEGGMTMIQPVPDGVAMTLGPRLRVQIQFRL